MKEGALRRHMLAYPTPPMCVDPGQRGREGVVPRSGEGGGREDRRQRQESRGLRRLGEKREEVTVGERKGGSGWIKKLTCEPHG